MNAARGISTPHHRRLRRIGAALLALAFLLGAPVDALVAPICPHHDVPEPRADAAVEEGRQGAPPEHSHHAGHPGHAGHHEREADPSASPPHEADSPGDEHGEHGPCTCVGDCHAPTTPAAHDEPAALELPAAAVQPPAGPTVDGVAPTRDIHRLLPFANGPPRIV